MDKFTIGDFVRDLNNNSRKLFEFIYKTYYPSVRAFIIKNKGNEQDAKDVFQEGIMAVIKNVEEKNADLESPLISYLFSICRYIWQRNYNVQKNKVLNEENISAKYSMEDDDYSLVNESIEAGIYQSNFKKLGKKCRDLLKLSLERVNAKDIARMLGFKSEGFVFKRKHQCKEQLMKLIKNDPKYKVYMKDKLI